MDEREKWPRREVAVEKGECMLPSCCRDMRRNLVHFFSTLSVGCGLTPYSKPGDAERAGFSDIAAVKAEDTACQPRAFKPHDVAELLKL